MRYDDGNIAHIGDEIELSGGLKGKIVCSIDTGEFSDDFSSSDWSYLKIGVLAIVTGIGLVHFTNPEPGMKLIRRGDM